MSKIKYLFQRLFSMSFKKMFETINLIHKKTNKNRVFLFFDMINCAIKYQAGYMDYKLYEMYDLNKAQRKTIITRGINNALVKKYNDLSYSKIFNDKLLFNDKFKEYLGREYLKVTEDNYDEFEKFALKHKEIVIKPPIGSCGKGVEIVKVTKENVKEIYNEILESKRYLVEEKAEQIEELKKIHPTSINTMRIVTLNGYVVTALLRMGNNHNTVDNFNSEGLVVPINIDTGTVEYNAIDKQMNIYERHPISNIRFKDIKIPNWDNVKKFTEKAAAEIPEMGYVGWDVSQNDKGPYLIEGNEFPGHDLYQLPPHRTNGIGLLPTFEKAMKRKK